MRRLKMVNCTFIKDNWNHLVKMNVCKANFLVSGINAMPDDKFSVGQIPIFKSQLDKFVNMNESVSILNSFPIFLYEYLKVIKF